MSFHDYDIGYVSPVLRLGANDSRLLLKNFTSQQSNAVTLEELLVSVWMQGFLRCRMLSIHAPEWLQLAMQADGLREAEADANAKLDNLRTYIARNPIEAVSGGE